MDDEVADDRYAPNRYSRNFDETLTVLVGVDEDEQRLTVHKDLICAKSKFFNAACSKLWAEGKEKLVRLPEAKAEAFQAYVVWIYTGKVVVNKARAINEFKQTVELYLLGDVLDDLQLRNEAMRTLVNRNRVCNKQPSVDMIHRIWKSTTPSSRLRKMIVDVIIIRASRKRLSSVRRYPKELLQALTLSLLELVPSESDWKFAAGLEGYLEPETSETS